MRCKNCHYSLANLTENRCPECATAFDPTDPSSFLTERQITVDRRERLVGVAGMGIALLAILILAAVTRKPVILIFMIPPITTVAILTWKHRASRETKGQ